MPEETSSSDQAKEQGVHTIAIQARRALIAAMAVLGAAVIMIATAGRADAAAAQTKCPNTFRVLHDDHVGKLTLKAGSYSITVANQNKLSCQRASDLFAKFLNDFDGKLSNGWKVNVKKSGFEKTAQKAFYVRRVGGAGSGGGGGGRDPGKGEMICPGTFQVQHDDHIGQLKLPKGPYTITVIHKKRITCQEATSLFAKFLQRPEGDLPNGWKLKPQSGTFLKKDGSRGFRVTKA
jgi:hypothetical protein